MHYHLPTLMSGLLAYRARKCSRCGQKLPPASSFKCNVCKDTGQVVERHDTPARPDGTSGGSFALIPCPNCDAKPPQALWT